ncbi:MAG: hypothetical protein GOU99_02545 [Candidatus Altiarchaeota archaeon]|nr:hypothetical protein [Candidatus Altiarchaeota archaeon]
MLTIAMLLLSSLMAFVLPELAVLTALVSFLFLYHSWSIEWLPGIIFGWAPAHPELLATFALVAAAAFVYARNLEKKRLAMVLLFCAGMLGFLGATSPFQLIFFLELMLFPIFYILLQEDSVAAFKYFGFMQVSTILVMAGLFGSGQLASALLTIGFAIKMGLFPFHSWLPDAHSQAPFSVSALLSGCVVAIGAYGILQYSSTPLLILPLGLISAIYGAFTANAETDIKRLLAYSTISQMGIAAVALSVAPSWVIAFLIMHSVAKSSLFLAAGEIAKKTGQRKLSAISIRSWTLSIAMFIALLSMTGFPPMLGFFTEFNILLQAFRFSGYVGLLLAVSLFPTILYAEKLLSIFFKSPSKRLEPLTPLISVILLLMGGILWMS